MDQNEIMNSTEVVDVIEEIVPNTNPKAMIDVICKGGLIALAVCGAVAVGKKIYDKIKIAKNAKVEPIEGDEETVEDDVADVE